MSTGHAHGDRPTARHYRELARIGRLSWFRRGLAIPKRLVRTSEIPWLGGSSEDLREIYVDPRFQGEAPYLGKPINVALLVPAVVQHEGIEGILLVLGRTEEGKPYDYDGAHELATAAEELKAERIIGKSGLRWDRDAYEQIFKPFLKVAVKPPWRNIPLRLNTEPYRQDSPALYREIERAMRRQTIERAA